MAITTQYLDGVLTLIGANGNVLATINVPLLYAETEGQPAVQTEHLIDPGTATKFGNMNGGGGLNAVFGGGLPKNFVPGGWYQYESGNAYAGLAFAAPKNITRMLMTAFADHGFAYTEDDQLRIIAHGKNGMPTGPYDGTVRFDTGFFTDANSLVKELVMTDGLAFTHNWATIDYLGGVVNGCALLQMFELR